MNKQHQETSGSFTACKVNNCMIRGAEQSRFENGAIFQHFPLYNIQPVRGSPLAIFVDVGSCWELDKLTCCTFSLLMESCCNSCNNPTSELKPIGLNVY